MILITLLGSMKNSEDLRERAQDHAPSYVHPETMTGCDVKLLLADSELPSATIILLNFGMNCATPLTCYRCSVCLWSLISILSNPMLENFQG